MFHFFKKSFWVPYEDGSNYPSLEKTQEAISNYCCQNNEECSFISEDRVQINQITYEIYRGYEPGSRGNYGIKCTEI